MCDEVCPCDEYLIERFNKGLKYVNTHDHLGDAAAEHEVLADHFLEAEALLRELYAKWSKGESMYESDIGIRLGEFLDRMDG
jgi:hypothetical protein